MTYFSLSDPAINENRYDIYADLRKKEPVYWYEPMNSWLVMRHSDIMKLLRSKQVTTNYLIQDKLENPKAKIDENVIEIKDTIKQWMIYNEGEQHTRLRKFMNMAFKRSYIDDVMPEIANIIKSQMSSVDLTTLIDFVESFAHPIPAKILCSMIGLEELNLDTFIGWSDSIANFMQDFVVAPTPDPIIAKETAKDLLSMKEALRSAIISRKLHPRSDLLSYLVAELEVNKAPITDEELMLQLIHLIFGGHKIPQFVMSNLMHCLFVRPELLNDVIKNPCELLDGAIHEVMRYESPIQFITRHATEDFTLHGKTINAGDSIYLMLGSANRDEEIFEKADTFDITRPKSKGLYFGSGAHTCIGAALVKDELTAIFNQLLVGTNSIEPLYDLENPNWTNNATFHGILDQHMKITTK